MLVLPRPKRQRSSSPPPVEGNELDISSPLDILIKRRRKAGYIYDPFEPPAHYLPETPVPGSSLPPIFQSEMEKGVERRRTKQWERRNTAPAPAPSHSHSHHLFTPTPETNAGSEYFSPAHFLPMEMERAYSQPVAGPSRIPMSSSPIRHDPPGSSPFRGGSSDTRVEETEWDVEELGREWGEEYANQNTLLYNLHRARMSHPPPQETPRHFQTPHHSSIMGPPSLFHTPHTNGHSVPTPYRNTQMMGSSSTHIPSSSPFPSLQFSDILRSDHAGEDDEEMEMLQDEHPEDGEASPAEREVRRRYEEANRLLAELEVERRRRWAEG